MIRNYVNRGIAFWKRYEHHIGLLGLSLGFFFDVWLADRPDSVANNILLLCYLLIAGTIIVLVNLHSMQRAAEEHPAEPLLLLFILQFCFGGLASNMLVLYGRSGTLVGSFIFIALFAVFLLGNEFLKSRYAHLRFNIGVYYTLVLTYCIIAVPTFILHTIGVREFVISGVVSLLFIAAFLVMVYFLVLRGKQKEKQLREVGGIVLGIFAVFNLFYFWNVIPPVPLSLKHIGIYHTAARDNATDSYSVTYEAPPWWAFWRDTSTTYTVAPGDPAYCFSSVFAPTELSAPIRHRWEYWDDETRGWITVANVIFPISGGRQEGYRGFSIKKKLISGTWRCDVETANGQLIGRITFRINQTATTTPVLSSAVL